MKESVQSAVVLGIFFGIGFGFVDGVKEGGVFAFDVCIFLGTAMAFLFFCAAESESRMLQRLRPDLTEGEILIEAFGIYLDKKVGFRDVFLILSNRELRSVGVKSECGKGNVVISLNGIRDVSPISLGRILPVGMKIMTNDNEHRFVILGRKKWIDAIERARRKGARYEPGTSVTD